MNRSDSRKPDDAALRRVTAARTHEARRALQAAKECLDNVARAGNLTLITTDSSSAVSDIGRDSVLVGCISGPPPR
jgi:hypothetical protein